MAVVRTAFPEGVGVRAAIVLEKSVPREIVVNRSFDYRVRVRNVTKSAVDDVLISSTFPKHLRIDASAPKTRLRDGGVAEWPIGVLQAGQESLIVIRVTPLAAGPITHCDDVSFRTRLSVCASFDVIAPKLRVVLEAPKEALLCDPIPLRLTLANVGTGTARDIDIAVALPEGIKTRDGAPSLNARLATLDQGQSREIPMFVEATAEGDFQVTAIARDAYGGEANGSAEFKVGRPVLELTKTMPSRAFVGRPTRVAIEVRNTGTFSARDLVLRDTLTPEVEVLKATDGVKPIPGGLEWALGELAVGQARKVEMTLRTYKRGPIGGRVLAAAWCAEQAVAAAQCECVGIPAILLEVIDVEDPIEVGQKETYIVKATNQGTARDTNIEISCRLENTMQYVSSSGPTEATVTEGGTVTFAPLPELAPKASASWKVRVQAVKKGDVRFAVQMNTDELGRPVDETEATNFYGQEE
ncbi:MAG: hypothetical protein HN742_02840 [Lentisphaerae bacterium]|jgi:hypothetical protein|nr:hypothetical protein [Lentisphaerota bacterium]MBT4819113.1 hypothetical protein [Lentisphaerota bacterium]MBT5608671.1 hypothetical protein [Lentisphaerota bacterium]MBT7057651.1 hypothetical protein [Lentisphaerota bacterium]MBT7840776.1 hypothetical protein [Lentisphaerota bacterium]